MVIALGSIRDALLPGDAWAGVWPSVTLSHLTRLLTIEGG